MDNDDYLPLEEFYKKNPLNHAIKQLESGLSTMTLNEPDCNLSDLEKHFILSFFNITIHCNSRQNTDFINALAKFFLKIKRIQLLNQLISYHVFIQALIEELMKDYSLKNEIDFYYQTDLIISPVIDFDKENSTINDLAISFASTSQQKLNYLTTVIELEIMRQRNNDPLLKHHLRYGMHHEGNILCIQQQNRVLKVKAKIDIQLKDYFKPDAGDGNSIQKELVACEKGINQNFLYTKRHTKFFRLAFDKFKEYILSKEDIKAQIDIIIPFGSVTQFTQNIHSDLEITIMTMKDVLEDDIRNLIHDFLLDNSNYINISFRPTKRTNLLIFEDKSNKVKVELNFNNVFGVLNGALIRNYLLSDARALIMVNTIKDWSKNNKINSNHEGYLSSYCFTLMVIYFLQRIEPPVLPIISSKEQLTSLWVGNHHYYIENALLGGYAFKPRGNNDLISVLILKFFLFYYAYFNEVDYCIDITNPIETIRNYDITYLNCLNEKKSKHCVYCFIDPFDYSYNPGAYLEKNSASHQRFKEILKLTIGNIFKGKPFLVIMNESNATQ